MEADWEFEVGGDAAVIDACWAGLVDLRGAADAGEVGARIGALAEVLVFPALGDALKKLNSARSPVWTAKCDFWPDLAAEDFDADELDAPAGSGGHALGCYIDLLRKSAQEWSDQSRMEADCRMLCARMREVSLRCCRVDLIVRRAVTDPEMIASGAVEHGITAYLTACGATTDESGVALESALGVFADSLLRDSTVQ